MEYELYHYGVKGMKWGVRKKRQSAPTSDIRKRYDTTKAAYKEAKKEYSKAYHEADNKRIAGISLSSKHRQANNARWENVVDKGWEAENARVAYKSAKKERKQAIKDTKKLVDKNTSFGEKLVYNDATRKKAAQYIVDHNMSMADAKKKANNVAWRNTAIVLGAYGALTVASLTVKK